MTLKIGYQGIRGSYSYEAANLFFAKEVHANSASFINFNRFEDVIKAVHEGLVDTGIIPLENSYAGRVAEIHNLFPSMSCYITGEYILPVRHSLLANRNVKIEDVKKIISHEQALMQCGKNIDKNFAGGVAIESFFNTAASALHLSQSGLGDVACIASKRAAAEYGLNILIEDFADSDLNYTTFIVVSKDLIHIEQDAPQIITSILFTVRNIPAAIYKAIGGFATNGVDLLKIESYIPGGVSSSSAQFFLSFYGHPSSQSVGLAMEELGFFATSTKLLGYYHADPKRNNSSISN